MTPLVQARTMTRDELMVSATCGSFSSFEDFMFSVREYGYVPTIEVKPLRKVSPGMRTYQASKNELARLLQAESIPVFVSSRQSLRGVKGGLS